MPRNSKRSRLFSESASTDQHHHEPLKGILKNSRIPTKRSVSECVDDLSQFMDDLEINIDDLKSRRFCSLHPFPEQVEYDEYSCDDNDSHDDDYNYENQDESDDDEDIDEHDKQKKQIVIGTDVKIPGKLSENHDNNLKNSDQKCEIKNIGSIEINNNKQQANGSFENQHENENNKHDDDRKQGIYSDQKKKLMGCACYDRYRSDSSDGSNYSDTTEPRKKSVRFDDHVYETVYIASRLYDRRAMAKYRFSSRHHPPPNGKQESKKQSKKHKTAKLSKSETKPTMTPVLTSRIKKDDSSSSKSGQQSPEAQTNGCRLTKSQRSKQSKKDKLKMKMRRKEESCSSDDQGYGSSVLNFSD